MDLPGPRARIVRSTARGPLLSPVVDDRSAWTTADFPTPREWVRPLAVAMVEEIEGAIAAARHRGVSESDLEPADFPLPVTQPLLASVLDDLERGRGFAVVSGLPVERWSYEKSRYALCGLCCHVGAIVDQTHKGERIIDVIDRERPYDHTSRGYHSNKLLPFHTDGADCVGLLCLGSALRGGLSVIASAGAVHNAVVAERPDLYETLCQGFYFHRRAEQAAGESPLSSCAPGRGARLLRLGGGAPGDAARHGPAARGSPTGEQPRCAALAHGVPGRRGAPPPPAAHLAQPSLAAAAGADAARALCTVGGTPDVPRLSGKLGELLYSLS